MLVSLQIRVAMLIRQQLTMTMDADEERDGGTYALPVTRGLQDRRATSSSYMQRCHEARMILIRRLLRSSEVRGWRTIRKSKAAAPDCMYMLGRLIDECAHTGFLTPLSITRFARHISRPSRDHRAGHQRLSKINIEFSIAPRHHRCCLSDR